MTQYLRLICVLAIGYSIAVLSGCGQPPQEIEIDGSSTVYPISEAVAVEFQKTRGDIRLTIGRSGTGGGMKRFIAGEIDICDASRHIKDVEKKACEDHNVEYAQLSVAFDGIAVVVNKENDWCDNLTVAQLNQIWRSENPAKLWNQINPDWPAEEINLYGPGTDSGTFDYFTKVINGNEGACRTDFTPSEDDNVLVTGVAQDKKSLGFFGFAYYTENQDKLKLVGIQDGEAEPVKPSTETVRSNAYKPLSRPLFIYVRKTCYERPEGKIFVDFFLKNTGAMAEKVGYVPVSDEVALENQSSLESLLLTPVSAN